MGAGRHRGGARRGRHVRESHRGHDDRGRRISTGAETVEFVVENAPHAIERLVEMGVPFNKDAEALHLTREGGHSHRRIVHVDDATGWAVQAALLKTAEAHPNITLLPGQACIDLITGRHEERYSGSGRVWGVYALDEKSGKVHAHVGRATILASGGAGRVYQFSTAPRGATGDGIAMAWRAGARVSNMEMMQFHPTCLLQSRRQEFPDHRGGARRGRHIEAPRHRPPLHARLRRARRTRTARCRRRARTTTRSSARGSIMSTSTSATRIPILSPGIFRTSTRSC